jgi:hypothetical protein
MASKSPQSPQGAHMSPTEAISKAIELLKSAGIDASVKILYHTGDRRLIISIPNVKIIYIYDDKGVITGWTYECK